MFRFRRRLITILDNIETNTIGTRLRVEKVNRKIEVLMSNQEVFDAYAARIHEQNAQIKAAVVTILQEIGKLQIAAVAATEIPLDTSRMEEALAQLTAAVDQVEAIPTPVAAEGEQAPVEEEAVEQAPVEVPVEVPVEEAVEQETVEQETVEQETVEEDEDK